MAKRERSTWGCLQEVRPGVWRLRYNRETSAGFRRVSETVYGTRRDAEGMLAQRRVEHGEDRPAPTVGFCYEKWWLPEARENLAPSSLAQYGATWKRYVAPRWADVPVDCVRPFDMQEWLLSLNRGAAEQACKILGRLLEYPLIFEVIERNPMRIAYRLPSPQARGDKGVYTYEELLVRWHELEESSIELPFLFAAFGSARVGESLGVRLDILSEISFERASNGMRVACVAVERQIDHDGNPSSRLKTKWSKRTLVIAEPMSLRIEELVESARQQGRAWAMDAGSGRPASQQALNRAWKRSFKGSSLEYHPFRNLRNSWRTFMSWEMGIEDEKLEKMMGHVGAGVTGRHYNRPDRRVFVEAVAQAFAAANHMTGTF